MVVAPASALVGLKALLPRNCTQLMSNSTTGLGNEPRMVMRVAG